MNPNNQASCQIYFVNESGSGLEYQPIRLSNYQNEMAATSIPDALLEQLVVTYLKTHTHIPGAWTVIEHFEQWKNPKQVSIPVFNSDLAARLTHLHNDDTGADMYRLRVYHPTNKKVIAIYFTIQGSVATCYTFSERTSYHEYGSMIDTFLKTLIQIPLNMLRISLEEPDFTYRFKIRKSASGSDDQVYHLTDFPTWEKLIS